jgi:anti-sigma28 factor (negative regulator of flagellin synthesis)
MGIQEILGNAGQADSVKGGRSDKPENVKGKDRDSDGEDRKDRVDVSAEARAMYDAERTQRFQAIREKIRKGFYFQRDVTEKVVDAVLKDLKKTP